LQIAGSQIAKKSETKILQFFAICDPAICNPILDPEESPDSKATPSKGAGSGVVP